MKYPKITTLFDRDPDKKFKKVIEGQYAKPEFEYLKDADWEFTEKVDGTNIRVILSPEAVKFKGKTDNAQTPPFLLDKLDELFADFPAKYNEIFPDTAEVILYGESYGARIQKAGKLYIPDGVDFILIDVYIAGYWLERDNIKAVGEKLGIKCVPILGVGPIKNLIEWAKYGFKSRLAVDAPAEGIVARPVVQLFNRQGERVIWKLKHKDF